jgi:hydroxyacylglutathione hydrolase
MNQVVTEQTGEGFYVAQFKTTQLAIFSYYIESQHECLLIDPVFDIDLYEQFFVDRKSKLKYVFLTHYHADFLSGHTEFKVPIIMGPTSTRKINTFKVHECTDGEVFTLGSVKVKVIHTPGHTMESSCFQLTDSANKDVALFSGDTVFLGEVGRPDLACSGNITSADLAGYLYDSVQKVRKL